MCAYVCACVCLSCDIPSVCVKRSVWLCACACAHVCVHKCVRPRACERGAVCVCDVAHVDIGKRAHVCAPLHVPVCAVVCGMVCVRGDTRRDASRASRRSHLTASPVYESSEGGEESAYDDRMSLEHLCATSRAARAHARRASDHRCQSAAARSAWRRLQSLHCAPHSAVGADGGAPAVHADAPHVGCARRWRRPRSPCIELLCRLCSQMEAPPQSLHLAPLSVVLADGGAPAVLALAPDSRLCSQMEAPPQSLHLAPHSVVLADGGAPAVLAPAPHSVVLADGGGPAVLAFAPHSVVLADGGAPAVLTCGF